MLEYNHMDYDKALATTVTGLPLGAPVGATLNAVSVRFQVAY